MESMRAKVIVQLVCSFVGALFLGTLQGGATFLVDPQNLGPVVPIAAGSLELLEPSLLVLQIPFFLVALLFLPYSWLVHQVYGEQVGTWNWLLFIFGWLIGLAPFFYVFQAMP